MTDPNSEERATEDGKPFDNYGITKESLYNLHYEQLIDGDNNDEIALQIVKVLGGIDTILGDYLKTDRNNVNMNNKMSQNQISQIYQLLKTPKQYQQQSKLQSLTKMNKNTAQNTKQETNDFYYEFNKNETFFHMLFTEEHTKKILNILHSKAMRILLALNVIVLVIIGSIFGVGWIYMIYIASIYSLMWIPYLIFWILSSNRDGFKLVMKSFELWIKMYYATYLAVLNLVDEYKDDVIFENGRIFTLFNLIQNILAVFVLILLTTVVSSFDAIDISRGWKGALSAMLGFLYILGAVYNQFLRHEDHTIYISTTNSTLSVKSMIADACQILGIFFWKQSYFALRRKGRAVIIKCSPFIKWVPVDHEMKTQLSFNIDQNMLNTDNSNEYYGAGMTEIKPTDKQLKADLDDPSMSTINFNSDTSDSDDDEQSDSDDDRQSNSDDRQFILIK